MLADPPGAEQPLFVDFVNTLHWDEGEPIELIGDRTGLAEWLAEHALPDAVEDAWLPTFWSLREHTRGITKAIVAGQPLSNADVAALKHAISEPSGQLVLVDDPDGRSELALQVARDDNRRQPARSRCRWPVSWPAATAVG